jgi:capsular exopolysaccharide synthesis family protein
MEPRGSVADDLIVHEDRLSAAIDLRGILATLYRSRYVMAVILVVSALIGVASILLMPRVYEASSSVQIDQQVAKVLGTEDSEPLVAGADADRFLQTQVDILGSRGMAKRVSDTLGLAANDSFLSAMGAKNAPATGTETRLDRVLDILQKNQRVDLHRNSRVVTIVFRSRDAAMAAKVSNSYAAGFIESNIQRKFSTSDYSRKFLDTQLSLAKARVEASERALIGYSRSARLIDASSGARAPGEPEGPRSLVTANLVQLNESFATAESARLQAEQRWQQARATPLLSLPEVLANDTVQRLLQRRAELEGELNQLRQRLKEDHPSVIQAQAQLTELNRQVTAIGESIRASIRNQYLTAQRQRNAVAGEVAALKDATLSEQDRSVQYNILKREVDTNRQLYESLLQRFKEVSAQAGVTTNNITMVDTAEVPRKPTSPRPFLNMASALLAGVFLALLYAFASQRLDDAIRDPRDVESKLRLPLLGVVPERADGNVLQALDDPKSDVTEAYHSIRTSIQLSSNQGLPGSLLVTSSSKAEGKSTTSFALARDFAMLGHHVLLVDADLRRPSLHRMFGMNLPDKGLSTVLARINSPEEAIVATAFADLSFLPSGPLPPDPATLFAGAAVNELLALLGKSFDVIVLDGPPVLALADATELAAAARATVFVVEAGSAHFGQARNAVERLQRAQGTLLGSIVTKYNSKKSGYGINGDYYRYRYDDDEPVTT